MFLPPPLKIYDKPVHFICKTKYLGLVFDRFLNWKNHFTYVKQKYLNALNKIAFVINSKDLSTSNKCLLYKTVLRPIITYACNIWGYAAKSNIEKLQVLQSKTLRKASKLPWYVSNKTIHNSLGVEPLRTFIVKLTVKFYKSLYAVPNEEIFNIPDYDEIIESKRPKSTLHIPQVISYRDPDYLPP